ncbi:helix-turn-helix domain-containing protein [Nonomuraea sp. NPDC004354]
MIVPASAGGNTVPVIARLVRADEDTVRDVIHCFNQIGPARRDPRRPGGRPRLLSDDDEAFVIQTTTEPGSPAGPSASSWRLRIACPPREPT